MLKFLCVSIACLIISQPAFSAEKPDFLKGIIKADTPIGNATLRTFFIKVYDGELWADGAWSYEKPFALKLIYDVSIVRDDFIESTFNEIQASSTVSRKELQKYTKDLETAFPDVKAGDSITAVYQPSTSLTFYFNGTRRHTMSDMKFAKYFFDIWFSKNTSEPKFRTSLLASTGE